MTFAFLLQIGRWRLTNKGIFRYTKHVSTNGRYQWFQWDNVMEALK